MANADDSDFTLTSPLSAASAGEMALLTLSIAWHADLARVGEQYLAVDPARPIELSRHGPLFRRPGGEAASLAYGGISRSPVLIVQEDDGIVVVPPAGSRMTLEINGVEARGAVRLTREDVAAGVVLALGRSVVLCLHWMRCLPKHNPVDGLIGIGSAAIAVRDAIRQATATDVAVLLLGETGTGKEVAARGIHAASRRADAPLVSVNMAALNEALAAADLFGAGKGAYTGAQVARAGLFAEARDATLFLDEIGNTPAAVQPMLLRVLETGEYRPLGASRDVRSTARVIAATDQDLYAAGFNQALLRRLDSFTIRLPPLRERREDIGALIVHLLSASGRLADVSSRWTADFVAQCVGYSWPGNVRQLARVVGRVMMAPEGAPPPAFHTLVDPVAVAGSVAPRAAASSASAESFSSPVPAGVTARKRLADLGEVDVLAAMEKSAWYIQGAAQQLGISRPSMYKLLESHSKIRSADRISAEELRQAVADSGGDLVRCASRLRTPAEPLRRHLRLLKLDS